MEGRFGHSLRLYRDVVAVEEYNKPLSRYLEVAKWLAQQETERGFRPTVLFTNIKERPGCAVLGNPYPRRVLLAALGSSEATWLDDLHARLQSRPLPVRMAQPKWNECRGLDAIPILQYRPGDAGPYITSGIGVTRCPDTGRINLGVYRVQVGDNARGRIFFDPRTDAYRYWSQSIKKGHPLPIAVFIGADPVFMLVAASRLPSIESDYEIATQLLQREVALCGEPPVPLDATYVIHGKVTERLETEGPFAEFKGYYVDARLSPVLEVDSVLAVEEPVYPSIVTGRESGLTLMAMQNEYLMYTHLKRTYPEIRSVVYPLGARGEFLALIETPEPSEEITRAAMDFDTRAKIAICTPSVSGVWQSIAAFGLSAFCAPYFRKGQPDGQRLGITLDRPPVGTPVEY